MLIEINEDKRCLVYCGVHCTCSLRDDLNARAMTNLEHELQRIFIIPKKRVRNVPIRKKKRRK